MRWALECSGEGGVDEVSVVERRARERARDERRKLERRSAAGCERPGPAAEAHEERAGGRSVAEVVEVAGRRPRGRTPVHGEPAQASRETLPLLGRRAVAVHATDR